MHQSLTNPTWSPETHSSTENVSVFFLSTLLSLCLFLPPFSARETTWVHLTTCIWSFLLNRKSHGGPALWVTIASNTILRSTEKVFSTCSGSIFHDKCCHRAYSICHDVLLSRSAFLNPSVLTLFTSLCLILHFSASKGRAPTLDCITPLFCAALFQGHSSRSLHQEKKWYWLWKQRAVSIYTRTAQPRNRAISFNLAFEAATAALSMGTVVLSQAVDLFPKKCQEVFFCFPATFMSRR